MGVLLKDGGEGCADGAPLGEQLVEDVGAFGAELVEALVALVLLAPLAGEQALGFQAAEERIEGAFLDVEAVFCEGFAEGVAVALLAESG